jgi:eukaryotic-like serine/threonine-protein kinase
VDGVDLQSRLREGPLPIAEAICIFRQVAEATGHAHTHGIVHCDLKPGNVLVDRAGRAVVTDFGFAHIVAGGAAVGAIGGTSGYIAPEILQLESPPTPAADIYALGALLWTLTTGGLPDAGDHPADVPNGPPPDLQAICRRCLAEEPDRRYRDVRERLAALATGRLPTAR